MERLEPLLLRVRVEGLELPFEPLAGPITHQPEADRARLFPRRRPRELLVKVELPELRSAAEIDLDITERNFWPCKCGYQICLFCYRHIKEDLNGLCPACRTPYDDANVKLVTPDPQE